MSPMPSARPTWWPKPLSTPETSELDVLPAERPAPDPIAETASTLGRFVHHGISLSTDPAINLLRALLTDAHQPRTVQEQLDSVRTDLEAARAGTIVRDRIYLFPREALAASKSAARSQGWKVSASVPRVSQALELHGWRVPNPLNTSMVSAVLNGKRRTAWEIPALVYGSAAVSPPPAAKTPLIGLRTIASRYGVAFLPPFFDRSKSTIEAWLAGTRTLQPEHEIITGHLSRTISLLETYRPDLGVQFWLRQPSKTLQTIDGAPERPLDAFRESQFDLVDHALRVLLATGS